MKKTILVLLMVLLSVMLVVSCKKEPEEAEIKYDDLIGYWQQGEGDDYIRIKFNKDGTVRLDEKSASYSVSYSITMTSTLKDNVITLIHTDGDKSVEYRYKLSFEDEQLVLVQKSETSMCFMHPEEIRLIMDKKNLG
jgi:hypothetical protein